MLLALRVNAINAKRAIRARDRPNAVQTGPMLATFPRREDSLPLEGNMHLVGSHMPPALGRGQLSPEGNCESHENWEGVFPISLFGLSL